MDTTSTYPQPRFQKTRTAKGCVCGGPCFYCLDSLVDVIHEHDHFPIPWRHGGRLTVPACWRCHSLKDRTAFGAWPPSAVAAANSGTPKTGEAAIGAMLHALGNEMPEWWCLADTEHEAVEYILSQVKGCTTPEARIGMAVTFNLFMDRYPAFPPATPVDPSLGSAAMRSAAHQAAGYSRGRR